MSTKVVKTPQLLKRRIEDFFDSRSERKAAREMIGALAEHAHAWIFGGMIRDIGLFGRKGFTSDIDIVVDSSRDELLRRISDFGVEHLSETRLGGIRFRYNAMDFDVWCLSDTWAFRENLIPLEGAHSLFKTTLMTWDAVLYDVHARQVISPDNYLNDLGNRRLELVLGRTPNEPGSLIRILRTIYNKHVEKLGPELSCFLFEALGQYSSETLLGYERAHYRTNSFTANQLEDLLKHLRQAKPGHDVKIPAQQLSLHFPE